MTDKYYIKNSSGKFQTGSNVNLRYPGLIFGEAKSLASLYSKSYAMKVAQRLANQFNECMSVSKLGGVELVFVRPKTALKTPISFEDFENAVMEILEDSPVRCKDRSDDDGKFYTFSTVGGGIQTTGHYSQLDNNRWTAEFMDRTGTGETLAEAIADMNKGLVFPDDEDEEEDL